MAIDQNNDTNPNMGFSTRAIHSGQQPCEVTGAIIPPIYMTSTYIQEAPAVIKGYDYTRAGNPNFTSLEIQIAALEQGKYATVFASGMSALTAVFSMIHCQKGSVVALASCYGGTFRLMKQVYEPMGISISFVKACDYNQLEKTIIEKKPTYFIFESPTNPLLEVIDIKKVVGICKQYGVKTILDNTFATPYHQLGLTMGIDIIIHSSTKFFGGHSDVIGGALITNDESVKESAEFYRKSMGLNPSPFDCWLLTRSLKTLGIRMSTHSKNAMKVAMFLNNHSAVSKVYYPGLIMIKNKPNEHYEAANSQMISGFSGIVSAEFNFTLQQTLVLISSFKVISLAESLGGVESLVDHPSSMTHASIPYEERIKIGLADGLVRFSVGIEDCDDIIADIEQAINIVISSN